MTEHGSGEWQPPGKASAALGLTTQFLRERRIRGEWIEHCHWVWLPAAGRHYYNVPLIRHWLACGGMTRQHWAACHEFHRSLPRPRPKLPDFIPSAVSDTG